MTDTPNEQAPATRSEWLALMREAVREERAAVIAAVERAEAHWNKIAANDRTGVGSLALLAAKMTAAIRIELQRPQPPSEG